MGDIIAANSEVYTAIKNKGFCICHGFFDNAYINALNKNIDSYSSSSHPGVIKENDGKTFRGIHGPHLYDDFFKQIAADKALLSMAEDILGESCYLHQFKINMKQKMTGNAWPWHEDFVYWREKDGIAEPKLINIAVLLDDSNMLNGPLCFIPGSHKYSHSYANSEERKLSDWKNDLSSDLNYQLDREAISDMIDNNGVEFAIGKAGDLLIFSPLIAHCSGSNLSPKDRKLLILTYNAISNVPAVDKGRPEFLCGKFKQAQPLL
uniref:Ectoine hydroxylase \